MIKLKKTAPVTAPVKNQHAVNAHDPESSMRVLAANAIGPAADAAVVVHVYTGKEVGLDELVDGLTASMDRSKGGDLSTMEAMLIGLAISL